MRTYHEMKTALKGQQESTRYFTKEFYSTFISEYRLAVQHDIEGVVTEEYQDTKRTKFYNENSGCYCMFLQLFYDKENLQQFCIEYSVGEWGGVKYVTDYAEDEETMQKLALARMEKPFKYAEVKRIA